MNDSRFPFRKGSGGNSWVLACVLWRVCIFSSIFGPQLLAQGLSPTTPARENIYSGGRLVAVEEAGLAIPAAPSSLAATVASSSQINLAWIDNSTNETGFKIERKTGSGGTYAQIATVGANVTSYSNTGLSASTTYYYRVRSYNASGDSAYSNEAYATTQAAQTGPTAPSSLTATKASSSQINLSWTDNSNNETGFKIERKTGAGGTYSQIATVGASVTSYSNTGLSNGTVYYYRVRAYNSVGNSSYSNEANACTGTLSGSGTYDSGSANIVYTGNWSNTTAYPLSYNTSLMYSATSQDKATFSFSGDSVTYVFTKDVYRGIVNLKIDEVDKGNLDFYSPYRLWQVAKTYSGLGSGNHTLQLTITGQKNASSGSIQIDVDAMIVGITIVGSGTYDERNSQVKWIGSWSQATYTGAYNNTLTYATTVQYAATFTFTGSQVTYIYSKHSQRGKAQVTIDGIDKGVLDLYSATLSLQQSTTYSSLGSGTHTIHLMVTGTKNAGSTDVMVDVDAFQVQ